MEYKNLIEKLNDIGEFIRDTYKDKLKSGGSIATGKLFNSVNYRVEMRDDSVVVIFIAENYYLNIEKGREPNGKFPPIEAIRKWIVAKGLPNKPGLEYLIARKISEQGVKAKPYLKETINMMPNITKDLEMALKKDLELSIKENLKNGNNNKTV